MKKEKGSKQFHVDVDITVSNYRRGGAHDFYHYNTDDNLSRIGTLAKAIKHLQDIKKEIDKTI